MGITGKINLWLEFAPSSHKESSRKFWFVIKLYIGGLSWLVFVASAGLQVQEN